jgi:pentatricopeptide repeat protein
LVCSLKACGSIGATKKGQEIHAEIERRGFLETDLVVGNSLVNMYIKCGSLFRAQHVFDQLAVRDMISWNTLLGGYTHLGDSSNVFSIFNRMVGEGIRPGPVTFLIVLNACSRKGLYIKGQSYLEAMSRDYGLAPSLEHHTCMIDLLSRKGKLNEALSIINDTPFSPDLVTWRTVLVACMNSGNVELGKHAFERAIVLDEKHAIPYVMMSKICAETGQKSYENSSSKE